MMRYAVIFGFLMLSLYGIFAGAQISVWEKANGYPYGRLCDMYRNCGR
jgi:hypothetical protein